MTTTDTLASLRTVHAQLDRELAALRRRAHLTPSEERRTRVLRKQKLRAKDLMGQLGRVADDTSR